MEYQVVLEFDSESRHYTATVPGLPVVVDSTRKRTAIKLAREGIALYLEETKDEPSSVIHAELVLRNDQPQLRPPRAARGWDR